MPWPGYGIHAFRNDLGNVASARDTPCDVSAREGVDAGPSPGMT
jgi:hypothetical protein